MIGNKGNFFKDHYDWLVLGVGLLALAGAGAFYVMSLGDDPDEAAANAVRNIDRMKPQETGVKPVSMESYSKAVASVKSPALVAEVNEKLEHFLASERRVKCKCGKAISGDVKAVPKCPFCGEAQEAEKVVVLDADNDGLPDEWEKKMGLDPSDASDAAKDLDNDGFTNLEEYLAKTDVRDAKDHPPYIDSLSITLPLKETYLPFVFRKATQVPGGWRCEFMDRDRKNDYGRKGRTITAKVGENLIDKDGKNQVDYGFIVKNYNKKEARQKIKGSEMTKTVDASEVVLQRVSDGKLITMVIQEKGFKPVSVDTQATLTYERMGVKTFEVVPGTEIDLHGTKFKVVGITAEGKGAKVVLESPLSGKQYTLATP